MEMQTWQILLESKHITDKNRSIEYFQRKKKISYLKESKYWLYFCFWKQNEGFSLSNSASCKTSATSKNQGVAACLLRSAGLPVGRAHKPPQNCSFPNSLFIIPRFFAATAAEREGCLGAACTFWISQPVWASDSPHGRRADLCCQLPVAPSCFLPALCCTLKGLMPLVQCRHWIADKVLPVALWVPGREVEVCRSQYLIPCGFPCGKRLQQWIPGSRCGKDLGELGNVAPRKHEGAGELPVSLAEVRGSTGEDTQCCRAICPLLSP